MCDSKPEKTTSWANPVGMSLAWGLVGIAAMALGARVEVPMVPVPMTLQTLAVLIVGGLSGAIRGGGTALGYLALAAMGAPVLAGGRSGLDAVSGPTAGYLVGFVVAAVLVGWMVEGRGGLGLWPLWCVMMFAHGLILVLGASWLATDIGWGAAMSRGVSPFLIGAAAKSMLAAVAVLLWRNGEMKKVG